MHVPILIDRDSYIYSYVAASIGLSTREVYYAGNKVMLLNASFTHGENGFDDSALVLKESLAGKSRDKETLTDVSFGMI